MRQISPHILQWRICRGHPQCIFLVSFLLFCVFSCLLYFLRNKFTLVLKTFDWVFACKIRLMHCKMLLYCIWKVFRLLLSVRALIQEGGFCIFTDRDQWTILGALNFQICIFGVLVKVCCFLLFFFVGGGGGTC